MMRVSHLPVALLCAALAPAPASAELYKWFDEQGRAQYSNIKPAKKPYFVIEGVPPADPQEQERARARHEREKEELKALEEERRRGSQASAAKDIDAQQRQRECDDARRELRFLEEAQGLRLARSADLASPEAIHWVDDKERAELIADWRQEVKRRCEEGAEGGPSLAPSGATAAPPPPKRRSTPPKPPPPPPPPKPKAK